MSLPLRIDTQDPRPIWRQIQEGVRHLVAQGRLDGAAPIPSVRDLAKRLQVNPATVAKAYRQLVADGVLVVRRGEGTFPAPSPPALSTADRRRQVGAAATRYAAFAITLGASRDESIAALRSAWRTIRKRESVTTEEPSDA